MTADSRLGAGFPTWFGASAVREACGAPKVVFHGTAIQGTTYDAPAAGLPLRAFTAFDPGHLGAVTESTDAKEGFWFTDDVGRAQSAAQEALDVGHGDSAYIYRVFLRIERPYLIEDVRQLSPSEVAFVAKAARRRGHDGLICLQGEGEGADYLVFLPTQIKSAHANVGAFDPVQDSICA